MNLKLLTAMLAIGVALPTLASAQAQPEERREAKKDRREERRDAKKQRRGERRDAKKDRREDRREAKKGGREDRRDARRERFKQLRRQMVVSGVAPRMGKPGTKVVIRGENFPPEATVKLAGTPVAATVSARRITFEVPPGAGDGAIVLSAPRQPDIFVGSFDTKGRRDKNNFQKRHAEREQRARDRLEKRWSQRAKDRAERERRHQEAQRAREASRRERARERVERVRARWERAFLASPAVQVELALHAERKARLVRMQQLADLDDREKLSLRIEVLLDREDARHEQRMIALKENFKGK